MKAQNTLKILGMIICLIGAVLMFDGQLLGERTTGLATVMSVTGISLICTSARKHRGR